MCDPALGLWQKVGLEYFTGVTLLMESLVIHCYLLFHLLSHLLSLGKPWFLWGNLYHALASAA